MGNTSIEWTDKSWSPLRAQVKMDAAKIAKSKGYTSLIQIAEKMAGHIGPHCEHVSPGCGLCYSGTNNRRCLSANGTGLPFDRRARDLIDPVVDEKILMQPLKWKRPVKVFVENQSDLFGEWNEDYMIDRVFAVMSICPQHTFQVLTKREDRMLAYFSDDSVEDRIEAFVDEMIDELVDCNERRSDDIRATAQDMFEGPLPNVWLGVSVENQEMANKRIPALLQTPAAVRFVSYEPALERVNFRMCGPLFETVDRLRIHEVAVDHGTYVKQRGIDWVIIGGESGAGARPFNLRWAHSTVEDCKSAGVPVFVKQLGARPCLPSCADPGCTHPDCDPGWLKLKDKKGGDMSEWTGYLRVREFPA